MKNITSKAVLAVIITLFCTIVIFTAQTKRPNNDEGWFGSTIYNLSTNGSMGTPIIEEAGSPYKGINQKTYWMPPAYFIFAAEWSRVFGLNLFSLRLASLFWAVLSIIALYCIARLLLFSELQISISILTLAFSYFFIQASANVRMDLMCQSLMMSGLCLYIYYREISLAKALFLGELCIVFSGLSHPHGIFGFVLFHLFVIGMDSKRITYFHIVSATSIYLFFGLCWGYYILLDLPAFKAQFFHNITSRYSDLGVFDLVVQEIKERYMYGFGLAPDASNVARIKAFVLFMYILSLLIFPLSKRNRRNRPLNMLYWGTLIIVVGLAFQAGKTPVYLITIIPFVSLFVGLLFQSLYQRFGKWPVSLALILFIGIQVLSSLNTIRLNFMESSYLNLAAVIKKNNPGLVFSSPEFGYVEDFAGLIVDDQNLGFMSGKDPNIIIIDKRYQEHMNRYTMLSPEFSHYRSVLFEGRIKIYDDQFYKAYAKTSGYRKFPGDHMPDEYVR